MDKLMNYFITKAGQNLSTQGLGHIDGYMDAWIDG
jgi:hypothetical protein